MLVSDKYKTIFIHINKTGGTSIEQVLRPGALFKKHYMTAREIRDIVGDKWDKYFKFAIVRNPWDKMASLYRYRKGINLIPSSWSFDDFIHKIDTFNNKSLSKSRRNLLRTTNQLEHCIDNDGNVILDYIGRFEDFKGSWAKISKKIGFKDKLPHVKSTKKHQHYSEYYTDELRDIVGDRFANDIEYFGYKFKDKR